jgi:hypothetical protein
MAEQLLTFFLQPDECKILEGCEVKFDLAILQAMGEAHEKGVTTTFSSEEEGTGCVMPCGCMYLDRGQRIVSKCPKHS